MVQAQVEIPETWDTIKYEKPLYPTFSRGKVGRTLYCNEKYHCYSVLHLKPKYDLTPYRATGFGFGERSMKYIPLTHVQDRSKPKPPKPINEKSEMKQIYERSIDEIKQKCERRNDNLFTISRYNEQDSSARYEIQESTTKTDADTRYRTHQINRIVWNYQP